MGLRMRYTHIHRRPVEEYRESETKESEYETDGEDIERSPLVTKEDELDQEEEYDEEELDEAVEAVNSATEEEVSYSSSLVTQLLSHFHVELGHLFVALLWMHICRVLFILGEMGITSHRYKF